MEHRSQSLSLSWERFRIWSLSRLTEKRFCTFTRKLLIASQTQTAVAPSWIFNSVLPSLDFSGYLSKCRLLENRNSRRSASSLSLDRALLMDRNRCKTRSENNHGFGSRSSLLLLQQPQQS